MSKVNHCQLDHLSLTMGGSSIDKQLFPSREEPGSSHPNPTKSPVAELTITKHADLLTKANLIVELVKEEVYMRQPEGLINPDHPHKVWCLLKSLYGLKQAPMVWNKTRTTVLKALDCVEASSASDWSVPYAILYTTPQSHAQQQLLFFTTTMVTAASALLVVKNGGFHHHHQCL